MMCKSISCAHPAEPNHDFCLTCLSQQQAHKELPSEEIKMSSKYPAYFKDVSELDEIDVYQVHSLFDVQDPSGCIHHASKKLLLSGVRTGGKTPFKDIKEARDTLTRWLQIYAHLATEPEGATPCAG